MHKPHTPWCPLGPRFLQCVCIIYSLQKLPVWATSGCDMGQRGVLAKEDNCAIKEDTIHTVQRCVRSAVPSSG
eukprot:401053-Pleurochrysis_carterae.AAC.2